MPKPPRGAKQLKKRDCCSKGWNSWHGLSMPAASTERLTLFLAPYSARSRVGEGGGLDHELEKLTVVEMPLDKLAAKTDNGEITDMKLLVLVQTLRLRHPQLFA